MKLEEILKNLPPSGSVKFEVEDTYAELELWRNGEGEICGSYSGYSRHYEPKGENLLLGMHFFATADAEKFLAQCKNLVNYDWVFYKDRAELKAEIKKLKEILLEVCDLIDCAHCPISRNCPDVDDCKVGRKFQAKVRTKHCALRRTYKSIKPFKR